MNLPKQLRNYIENGGTQLFHEDGDWQISVEETPPSFLKAALPAQSQIIANNGIGDYLYVTELDNGVFGPVMVYWHEEQASELFSNTLSELVLPKDSSSDEYCEIVYRDGQTRVLPGDAVSARDVFWRKRAVVTYVPGLSAKRPEMEHHGLRWVGLEFENGVTTAKVLDPDTKRLERSIVFVGRKRSNSKSV